MQQPYTITPRTIELVAAISEKIGEVNANHLDKLPAELRKSNRIKTIQSTLGLEGNALSTDQLRAVFENKPAIGPARGLLEARNALEVYNRLRQFKATSFFSLLRAHKLMMNGLMESPGKVRAKEVEILKKDGMVYFALARKMVKPWLRSLFAYLKNSSDFPLVKSCVVHYELSYIHPFALGNGRLGRLWQAVILTEHYPVFEFLPYEVIVWREQDRYVEVLNKGNLMGKSTSFIEFMLGVILESLEELLSMRVPPITMMERIERFREDIDTLPFARKDYMKKYKDISSATASRDLREGVEKKMLKKSGDKRNANYRFVSA